MFANARGVRRQNELPRAAPHKSELFARAPSARAYTTMLRATFGPCDDQATAPAAGAARPPIRAGLTAGGDSPGLARDLSGLEAVREQHAAALHRAEIRQRATGAAEQVIRRHLGGIRLVHTRAIRGRLAIAQR